MIARLFPEVRARPVDRSGAEVCLSRVPLDVEVEVTRIDVRDIDKVHRLAALGILPGARLRLILNRGAYIAVIERDQVAFDANVAAAVWVRCAE